MGRKVESEGTVGNVSIVRTETNISEAIERAVDLIGGLGHYVGRGDRVMLKPNLNGVEGCTNIEVTEALIRMLLDFGVREVFIGESTFGDARMTRMFFEKTGYKALAGKYGVEPVNLNESEAVELTVANPQQVETIRVAREALDADRIINLPNMKVHYATGVTLAMKNLKGMLVGPEKRRFHEEGLDGAIVDLNNTVKTDLNVIDCISCMERMGPRGGDIIDLGLLIAGEDIAEVDYAGCLVMGYDLEEVKHLDQYVAANDIDLGAVEIVGEKIDDVRRPFEKVALEGAIPRRLRIHDTDACSACMNALLLSAALLKGELTESVDVYLGSHVEGERPADGISIAFGNCRRQQASLSREIRGCPPYPFALGECLKDLLGSTEAQPARRRRAQ